MSGAHARVGQLPLEGSRSSRLSLQRVGECLAEFILPFVLILYLSLRGGGYDTIVRGEVGVLAWWLLLLGVLIGMLPAARLNRPGFACLLLLGAFAVWTGLGIGWSASAERSVGELTRVLTYLGVFALAISIQGRSGLRRMPAAVGTAITVVALLAVLSRLHPSWFPESVAAETLPDVRSRLAYPLNYWNGVAALISIGMPLMIWLAASSRTILGRAASSAAIPVLSLAAFYTLSRGGAMAIAIGVLALLALYPRRLALLPPASLGILSSSLVIAAATQRDALESGLLNAAASDQGNEMLAIVLVVCAGVALVSTAIALAERAGFLPKLRVPRAAALTAVAAVAIVGVSAAVAVGAPGKISERWQEFKQPSPTTSDTSRFVDPSGNGRWQYWSAAVDANASEPLVGIGPGTYELWWDREGTLPGTVRDAHSLYLETFGELGVIGLVLIGGFLAAVVMFGCLRALGRGSESQRAPAAALTAALIAFAAAAAVDWSWEIAVLPIAFLLLAAAVLSPPPNEAQQEAKRTGTRLTLPLVASALASIVVIAVPMAAASAIETSQQQAGDGDLVAALVDARSAETLEPYAATPRLQQALVLELMGNLAPAEAKAEEATAREPTNWKTWLVLSRLRAERADAQGSVDAYRRARALNPRSLLFPPT